MQPSVATAYVISDPNNNLLLPYLSLTGPISTCPNAKPNIDIVRLNCTAEFVQENSLASDGNAGKYISVTKGPNAERKPSVSNK